MKVIWKYDDYNDFINIPMSAKIRGLRRQGHRPNKIVIGFQEYKDAVDEIGIIKVDEYIYKYLIPTVAPRNSRIYIELLNR